MKLKKRLAQTGKGELNRVRNLQGKKSNIGPGFFKAWIFCFFVFTFEVFTTLVSVQTAAKRILWAWQGCDIKHDSPVWLEAWARCTFCVWWDNSRRAQGRNQLIFSGGGKMILQYVLVLLKIFWGKLPGCPFPHGCGPGRAWISCNRLEILAGRERCLVSQREKFYRIRSVRLSFQSFAFLTAFNTEVLSKGVCKKETNHLYRCELNLRIERFGQQRQRVDHCHELPTIWILGVVFTRSVAMTTAQSTAA